MCTTQILFFIFKPETFNSNSLEFVDEYDTLCGKFFFFRALILSRYNTDVN